MEHREVVTLMHRLFYGDIPDAKGYTLLGDDADSLDKGKVDALLDRYIPGDEILLFVNEQNCIASTRDDAFHDIERLIKVGRVKVADPRFRGRVVIEQIGVGVGSAP